jgi:hypothetical protein
MKKRMRSGVWQKKHGMAHITNRPEAWNNRREK